MASREPAGEFPQGTGSVGAGPADAAALEWRVWLAGRCPARACLAVAVVAGAALVALLLFRSALPAAASAALLLAAVGEFLLPTHYRLGAEGAEARNPFYWRRLAWREVKRVCVGEREVKLSPLANAGPRDAFRGVVLRYDGNRDDVLAAVKRFRDAAA